MIWSNSSQNTGKNALILSGGGARAAYQVGVLKGLADLFPKENHNPFPILCGTSAGAINATALAIYSKQFREAVWRLLHVWGNFEVNQVFRTDYAGFTKNSLHWFAAMAMGGMGKYNPSSLLDREPLRKLLLHYFDFNKISEAIKKGRIDALCITASSYTSGYTTAFYQSRVPVEPWFRTRRMGIPSHIGINHLMASSAIPYVFSSERIGDEYYGDGTMRQTAPLSPAIHLGADRILVIGVKHEDEDKAPVALGSAPSLGQIAGHVLDSIFLDNMDLDVERLSRINKTLSQIPDRHIPEDSVQLRKLDILGVGPSEDLYKIAQKHAHRMPRSMRIFLRGLGVGSDRGSNLVSYLLFERHYCRELIDLGYGDTLDNKEKIQEFFQIEAVPSKVRRWSLRSRRSSGL